MAIDFTTPAVTQNYSSGYTAGIVANILALGMMLDPTLVGSYAGLATGVKRFNETTGIFERYNGTSWVGLSTGYLLDTGDTLTGILVTNNNVVHQWKDSGGTARSLLNLNSSNNFQVGDSGNVITSGTTSLYANTTLDFRINGSSVGTVTSSGWNTSITHLQTASEGIRLQSSAGFMSGYNTANTTRTGYLQFNAAASVILAAENGAQLQFSTGGTTALTLSTTQAAVFSGTVTMPNNVAIYSKDSGGVARAGILLDSANNWNFGDLGSVAGGSTSIKAVTNIYNTVNGTQVGLFTSSGLQLLAGQLYVHGFTEAVRIASDTGYLSIWNAANTTRTGYLQGTTASAMNLVADTGNVLQFGSGSVVRAKLDLSGVLVADQGFATTAYATNAQNPIWRFYNSTGYGISYFQGTSGLNGADSLGIHLGTATAVASYLSVSTNGISTPGYALVGNITTSTWAAGGRGVVEIGGTGTALLGFRIGGGSGGYLYHDGTNILLYNSASGQLQFSTGATTRYTIGATGINTFTGAAFTNRVALGSQATLTVDWKLGNYFTMTLTGNVAAGGWVFSNPSDGQTIIIKITQDGTGSRTIAANTSVKWPGGSLGVLSTAPGAVDILCLTYDANTTFFYATLAKGFA